MGHSQAEKALSRERIISQAAKQIRESGLDSVSVGSLMKSVNLTHGGFYGHFESRAELIVEALKRALDDSQATSKAAAAPARPQTFAAMVRRYLSGPHRDSRGGGCAIASLAADVGRADELPRCVMEEHINSFMTRISGMLGEGAEDEGIVAVSAMIGALAISRVMTDTKRSDQILRTVRDYLIDAMGEEEKK
jgi:TetR/AcrR family transcriptional regulator, transcriptional repressor for nem operon